MRITLLLAFLAISVVSRSYPVYKQCDAKWGYEQLGSSPYNICQGGSVMTSAAMALAGVGQNYNPSTLNKWLKANGGYLKGDSFIWESINKLGLAYTGSIPNSAIKSALDRNDVVIVNVRNGAHWALAYGYNGDSILVNDPLQSNTAYNLNEIVNGRTGVYISTKQGFVSHLVNTIKHLFSSTYEVPRKLGYAPVPAGRAMFDTQE